MNFSDDDLKRLKERFLAKTKPAKESSCWLWVGAKGSNGYGQMQWGPKKQQAHRIAWMIYRGPIPKDITVDHLCRVKACVYPMHLRLMTMLDNVMDGCRNIKKTHCPKGHEYNKENTIRYRTFRYCRTCKQANDRTHHLKYRDRILSRKREAWRKEAGK